MLELAQVAAIVTVGQVDPDRDKIRPMEANKIAELVETEMDSIRKLLGKKGLTKLLEQSPATRLLAMVAHDHHELLQDEDFVHRVNIEIDHWCQDNGH